MAQKKVFTVPFRRKRETKTDYRRRLGLLKSGKPRLVVRKSNKHMQMQLIKYGDEGDRVIVSAHTKELKKFGWDINTSNLPAAYLAGLLLGTRAKDKEAILDLGLQAPLSGTRLFAAVKGCIDGGLNLIVSEEIFPPEKTIEGKNVADYASKLKESKEKYEKYFSSYLENKKDPEKIQEYFKKTKEKILKS